MGTIVVGNSAELLKYEIGSWIDSFDTVVRFNKAKTGGYEKHLGSKFDVWATSDTFNVKNVFKKIYWISTPNTEKKIMNYLESRNIDIVPSVIPHGYRFRAARRLLGTDKNKRLHLTTGMALVLWGADHWEERFTVVGFDGYSDQSEYAEYYSKKKKKKHYKKCKDLHKNILQKLHDQGRIYWRQNYE